MMYWVSLKDHYAITPADLGAAFFDTLCPSTGSFHCTGKKWSIEVASGKILNDRVRLHIASLVTDTCTLIRQRLVTDTCTLIRQRRDPVTVSEAKAVNPVVRVVTRMLSLP